MVYSKQIELFSKGGFEVMNLTGQVGEFLEESGLRNGRVYVFYQHSTGSVIIGEHETGIMADLYDILQRIAPETYHYKHHIRDVDFNGHAHIHAALMQPEVSVPVINGALALGTYQDILVIDEQVDAEPRYLILQAMGDTL